MRSIPCVCQDNKCNVLCRKALVFPGKGLGPGFSLCCRPSALDRTLKLSPRRIFLYAFLQGFLNRRWFLHAFLQGLLNPVHGNVVFSRSKLHALHKSLVFFRSLLLPAVANLMFCVLFCMFLYICVWFCAYVLQFVAGSSWVELIFECNFTVFFESRLWECRVFSFKNGCAS